MAITQNRTRWMPALPGLFLLFSFSLFLPPSPSHAATPPTIITYQGKLLVNNLAATTTQSMKFVLYSALTGGTALYTATGSPPTAPDAINVTPTNGIFIVNLGDTGTNSLSPTLFQTNQNVFLEVTVGSEILSPRKQITAAPFAFNAKYLDGVAATSTASSSTYIPISDSLGNFNFNAVSTTAFETSATSTFGSSILTSGTIGATPASGAGTRLMWIPSKAAFRAGAVVDTKWDDSNIGSGSVAFGHRNMATGTDATALGFNNRAIGDYAFAAGNGAYAVGINSVSIGYQPIASGVRSMAFGGNSISSGQDTIAIGYGTEAVGQSSLAMGIYASTTAGGLSALALGYNNNVAGIYATALGSSMTVSGASSVGINLDYNNRAFLDTNNRLAIVGGNVWIGTTTAPVTNYRLYIDSGASTSPAIGANGYIKATGFVTGTSTLDVAELYPVAAGCDGSESCPEVGDVVCVTEQGGARIERCSSPYSPRAIGVVSGNPGFTLGGLKDQGTRPVALSGRVPIKVTARGQSIAVGDRLTSSASPGIAEKATRDGFTIAIALESYADPTMPGTILAFVNVSYSVPGLSFLAGELAGEEDYSHSLQSAIRRLASSFVGGVLRLAEIVVDTLTVDFATIRELKTEKICLDEVCITSQELKQLLERQRISDVSPAAVPLLTATPTGSTVSTTMANVASTSTGVVGTPPAIDEQEYAAGSSTSP